MKMKLCKIILVALILTSCSNEEIYSQSVPNYRSEVIVENGVFKVWYNEVFEQPMKLIYTSTNRPKGVDRGSMNFYTDDSIHTSDNKDYYRNIYDKGHLAPAATYSDNMENLKLTFSYLNCALQDQYLNRGEWRLLEEEERKWDDKENLTVTVELLFENDHKILPTGGHIPDIMVKHVYFETSKNWKCFSFPNVKPEKGWEEHEVKHTH
jgi:endonuclease G, mitochondrial